MTPRTAAAIAALTLVGLGAWAAWMVGIPLTAIGAGSAIAIGWSARRLAGRRPAALPGAGSAPPPRDPTGS